jgi:hypothetical protein
MVRVWALRALDPLGASLAPDDVAALLEDPDIGWQTPEDRPEAFGHDRCGFLQDVVAVCRSPLAQAAAFRHLKRRSALDRASLLMVSWTPWEHPLTPIESWLYERWRCEDWLALDGLGEDGDSLNLQLASFTHLMEPSRDLLIAAWRAAWGARRRRLLKELPEDADGTLTRATEDRPGERRELAEAFRLGHATLVAFFGSEEALLDAIEATVRGADAALGPPDPEESSSDPSDPPDPTEALGWQTDFGAALQVLEAWPYEGAGGRIAMLLGDVQLSAPVRRRLLRALWNRDRPFAASAARLAAEQTGDPTLLRWVLQEIAWEPRPEDRELLLWTVREVADDESRYFAIEGLEELREASPDWAGSLAQLARSADPGVRLQAIAGLVRSRDEEHLPLLLRAATEGESARIRAEAIRLLGRLDAGRFYDLFQQALMTDSAHDDGGYYTPAAEEAARALVRIDTPAARTALLQGYLVAHSHPLEEIIETYFEALAAIEDGREMPSDLPPHDWRPCWWPDAWE